MLTSSLLEDTRHGFFTRRGGVSEGIFASLNFAVSKGDDPGRVARNRQIALDSLQASECSLLLLRQIHSASVLTVSRPWPLDSDGNPHLPEADALVTATPGLVIGVITADCAPVLLYDPQAGVIGAAHAGWRGAFRLSDAARGSRRLGRPRRTDR